MTLRFLDQFSPMDPCHSGVASDSRMAFYSIVLRWSNTYAHMHFNTDATVGHHFNNLTLQELVRFDGIVIRNGVLGGHVSFHLRWDKSDFCYDATIANAMQYHRFLQIKAAYKLCINEAKKHRIDPWLRASTGLRKKKFNGYGEADSGMCSHIMGKPGITRGGQVVIISDTHRYRPRGFLVRHKCQRWPTDWTERGHGPNEVRKMMEESI
jgi:hypothetical protein